MSDQLLPIDHPCYGAFRASGLGSYSYPIEVGWSEPDGTTHAVIIRPQPDWTLWDQDFVDPQHVTYADLVKYGRPPRRIAEKMNADLDGQLLFTDGGLHDRYWLDRLYEAAGLTPSFTLCQFRYLLVRVGCTTWGQRQAVEEYVGDSFSGPRAADRVRRLHSLYHDTQFVRQISKQ